MSLAKFIVLKSNATNKYLCHGKDKGATHASLRFSREMKRPEFLELEKKNDESLEKPSEKSTEFHLLKFEVEEAKTAKGFVHIRTCYNRKYWVRKSADTKTIVAEAHEPEEDQSKWSCTLFKPVFLGDADDESDVFVPPNAKRPQRIQLIHISELGHHPLAACPSTASLEVRHHVDPNSEPETTALKSVSAAAVTLTAFDVEPTVILPWEFTFMSGDGDGKYMAAYNGDSLGFTTTDVGTEGVAMCTYEADYPTYMPLLIQQPYRKWRINQNNDVGLVDERGNPSLFGPVKFDKHVVLHCQQNNNFVSRTKDDGVSCRSSTITAKSMLIIGEPVTLRTILSAEYNLEDARTYGTGNIQKYVDSISNNTSQAQNATFEVKYKTSKTMSWNQSTEVHVGVNASWSFGIPYVGKFGIEVSYDRTQTCQWGEEDSHEETVKITRTVTIPPGKKVTLKVMAMKSSCDVPFTCKVRDVMCDGRVKEYTKTDGLFVGSNEFDFTTVMDEVDL